jgi:UDP-N-acetylglucosamine/UDP-N-acetylgalactosamine diphosphorylase
MKTYGIGEVAKLLGVKPYIIRYWESELPLLAPRKGLSGRRAYSGHDVQLLLKFKHLLYARKFTIEGAKRKIWEELGGEVPDSRGKIARIRGDLVELLMTLQGRRGEEEMTEKGIIQKFTSLGHGHLFDFWDARPEEMKKRLLEDLESLEVEVVEGLRERLGREDAQAAPTPALEPTPYVSRTRVAEDTEARAQGERLIAEGRTAVLTVAGGQGTRLGYDGPKGMYPISPIRKLTLFEIAAEKLLAARRRYGARIPWLIMTSPQNHRATVEFFSEKDYFGLEAESMHFFTQGVLPSLSAQGGLLMGQDGGLFFNPNGHGGAIEALRTAGLLERMSEAGVEELFYFQVDNPLVTGPDASFLGFHRREGSRVSSKVIKKAFPEEKIGVIGMAGGKPAVIEYSDLGKDLMYAKDAAGDLLFHQGSIAIHLFNLDFLKREGLSLPYHLARKKVKTLNPTAGGTEILEREAAKFEMFIFDSIPLSDRALFLETDRVEEFSPLKNREGVDSVETCTRGQTEKFAGWLEKCGVDVPRGEDGRSLHRVEISPLFAMDVETLASRRGALPDRIDGDTLLA